MPEPGWPRSEIRDSLGPRLYERSCPRHLVDPLSATIRAGCLMLSDSIMMYSHFLIRPPMSIFYHPAVLSSWWKKGRMKYRITYVRRSALSDPHEQLAMQTCMDIVMLRV